MKRYFLSIGVIGMCLSLCIRCNPACDTPYTLEAHSPVNLAGSEVLLRTSTPSFLDQLNGRSVFINNNEVSPDDLKFYPDFGLVVKTPSRLEGNINLTIEDFDCGTLGINLSMMDEQFFDNNPNFIVPSPPDIVIPSIPPIFPQDITNAWISPQNPDYCLWFGPYKTYEFEVNGEVLFEYSTNVVASGSFELSACGNTDSYYHNNPFFGVVDTVENYVEITIDRTAKSNQLEQLDRETFVGQFIDLNTTNYAMGPTNPCHASSDYEQKVHMLWLQSKQTGRQLVLYKLINP